MVAQQEPEVLDAHEHQLTVLEEGNQAHASSPPSEAHPKAKVPPQLGPLPRKLLAESYGLQCHTDSMISAAPR